jgi:hypothetical protein
MQPQPPQPFGGLSFSMLGNHQYQGAAASHQAAHAASASASVSSSAHAGVSPSVAQWQMSDLDGAACADHTAVLPHAQRNNVPLVVFLHPPPPPPSPHSSAVPLHPSGAPLNSAAPLFSQFQPPPQHQQQHQQQQQQQQHQQQPHLFPPRAMPSPPHAHGAPHAQAGRARSPSPSRANANVHSKQPRV